MGEIENSKLKVELEIVKQEPQVNQLLELGAVKQEVGTCENVAEEEQKHLLHLESISNTV